MAEYDNVAEEGFNKIVDKISTCNKRIKNIKNEILSYNTELINVFETWFISKCVEYGITNINFSNSEYFKDDFELVVFSLDFDFDNCEDVLYINYNHFFNKKHEDSKRTQRILQELEVAVNKFENDKKFITKVMNQLNYAVIPFGISGNSIKMF